MQTLGARTNIVTRTIGRKIVKEVRTDPQIWIMVAKVLQTIGTRNEEILADPD